VIGPTDSFLLFLHWLRQAAPIVKIAGAFSLNADTFQKCHHEMTDQVHDVLVDIYITGQARAPLPRRLDYPGCGILVDATVQDRGRPVGRYENAQKYFPASIAYTA
jgi:hypothetical protein